MRPPETVLFSLDQACESGQQLWEGSHLQALLPASANIRVEVRYVNEVRRFMRDNRFAFIGNIMLECNTREVTCSLCCILNRWPRGCYKGTYGSKPLLR